MKKGKRRVERGRRRDRIGRRAWRRGGGVSIRELIAKKSVCGGVRRELVRILKRSIKERK